MSLLCLVAVAASACRDEAPTAAGDAADVVAGADAAVTKVEVCHKGAADGSIVSVGEPALGAHLAHGDYVTTLHVQPTQAADGVVRFARIGDALAAARAGRLARDELVSAACRITIAVPAGTFAGTHEQPTGLQERFPLMVDVPDLTLRGALAMALDTHGRATGASTTGEETILQPVAPLPFAGGISTPLIAVNAHPGGSAGDGFIVEGLVFRSGNDPAVGAGGQGVLAVRASDVLIKGNRFEGGFTESIDVRGGSVTVRENHLGGGAGTCDVCLAGPGTFVATGNRLLAGGIPGIVAGGVVGLPMPPGIEPMALPAAAESWFEFTNNFVRDHQRKPVGSGLRVDGVGVMATNVHNTLHVTIRDNELVNNRFGLIVHGAFPLANTLRRADIDVALGGNVITQSCQAKLLVSLSRHTTALGITNVPWLLSSSFTLTLNGDLTWDEAWYGHPAGFGNTLVVDGQSIPNGINAFYSDPGCPAGTG